MAMGWRGVVSEQANLIFSRLGQLVASSLRFLHDELGIDLGIKPDLYPLCGLVCAAVIGGFVALLVWLAACGGRKRKHGAATSQSSVKPNVNVIDSAKTEQIKPVKTEEPKKKNRKKAADKKTQSNGGTIPENKQEVKVAQELLKKQPQPAPAPPQPPADVKVEKAKKSKKKPKLEVKQPQGVSATDGKEPDEGAWETKISNREKRQQRRKEKGPGEESGSPGGDGHVSRQAEQPSVPASISTKKNKGNKDSSSKAAKGDPIVTPAPSTWNAVNSGGWAEMTVKIPPQVTPSDSEKWHVGMKTSVHRNAEPLAWGQESETGSWTTVDGRIKKELNQVNFSVLGLSPAAGDLVIQPAAELGKWDGFSPADEWSGCNGLGAGDPNSDWDAPSEVWGNYEEPKVETPAAQEKPVSQQTKLHESDDDKEKGEPSGNGKSKRRKKKKKTPEAENASSQANTENVIPQSQGEAKGKSTKGLVAPAVSGVVKPHPQLPVDEPTKQSVAPLSNQKKSDQNWEPPKQVQKKKARRET